MRVNREATYKLLMSLTPGLSTREILEQSSCIVLTADGRAMAFNDEVCASRVNPFKGVVGAIKAKPLLDMLGKMTEDDIDVEVQEGALVIKGKGKGRKSTHAMEGTVNLPVNNVDIPHQWRPLDPLFCEGVNIVHTCACKEESEFVVTCVHIHPDYLEATDHYQIARYPLKTGVDRPILVKADSLRRILGFDMIEISETAAWVHFRNATGLIISVRRDLSTYPELDDFLAPADLYPITLPGGLKEAVSKAEIFSIENTTGNNITVDIQPGQAGATGWMYLKGEGVAGNYLERQEITYSGRPFRFAISPKLLIEISNRASECGINSDQLFVNGGKFLYATSTKMVQNAKQEAPAA